MAKKKKTSTTTERSFSPMQVTFGVAILAAVSLLALAVLLFTTGA